MRTSRKIVPETKKTQNKWPMIIYDRSIQKSAQNILYQVRQERFPLSPSSHTHYTIIEI